MNREHWKELLPIITAFANGERVDFQMESGEWVLDQNALEFIKATDRYRIAPRTIRIGKYDVPEPYRGEMKEDQEYYVAYPTVKTFHVCYNWGGDSYDDFHMSYGLVHLTPESAAIHGKALASLTAGEGVEL